MKFTSSRRSGIAVVLCASLVSQAAFLPPVRAEDGPEPALLLKFVAPDIPEGESRTLLDPLAGQVAQAVRVRWVPLPASPAPAPEAEASFPFPDDAALKRISEKLSRAAANMERLEDTAAGRMLAEAESEARGYRFTEATLPFLAEIFLRGGILKLREGDTTSAELLFARSRALHPRFSPDPALFPPAVQTAWRNAARRPPAEPELLVQSLPSGADIFVDGRFRGKTPSRVRPGKAIPVRIRVSHGGFKDAVAVGQWLPGDTATLDFPLAGDRVARLGELFSDGGRKRGRGSGPLVDEFAAEAGVSKVAVVTLERDAGGTGYLARAYSRVIPGGDPLYLGEERIPAGDDASEDAAKWVTRALIGHGWPDRGRDPEATPWYKSYWLWGTIVAGAVIAAVLAGGGGGGGDDGSSGSGSSDDSSIVVNF